MFKKIDKKRKKLAMEKFFHWPFLFTMLYYPVSVARDIGFNLYNFLKWASIFEGLTESCFITFLESYSYIGVLSTSICILRFIFSHILAENPFFFLARIRRNLRENISSSRLKNRINASTHSHDFQRPMYKVKRTRER